MTDQNQEKKSLGAAFSDAMKEIKDPIVGFIKAPRALWGVNISYLLEGFVYFGMLGYLAMHFSSFIFRGVENADIHSHHMVLILTAGITIAMFFLGFIADKYGVRRALIWAFLFMLAGRLVISGAPTFGLQPAGLWSPLHIVTVAGIILVVIGYGMYQPAAYAAVRKFTNPKSAGMAYAMLYALMNLGGYLPSFMFLLRDDDYAGLGIVGTYWFYTGLTAVALFLTVMILTKKTVNQAIEKAKAETEAMKAEAAEKKETEEKTETTEEVGEPKLPIHWWGIAAVAIFCAVYFLDGNGRYIVCGLIAIAMVLIATVKPVYKWVALHPFSDLRFFFFIFALIPVQTLFTYNWLILPQYINRTYEGVIGKYFELASNFNPLLIFLFVPIVTALTQKRKVYNMMIIGTTIMAAPAFLLSIEPTWYTLFGYLLIMTIGEAMWQPRFLQYAAEIAPEGRTGVYMGVAQFPWFMTKVIVPLYSGYMLTRYCPLEGARDTESMWLIFACIAMVTPILLILSRKWMLAGMKDRHDD